MEEFEAQMLEEDERLRRYRVSHACWDQLSPTVREHLCIRRAESLKAINYSGRVAFTRALVAELGSIKAALEPVYFVTLISRKHAGTIAALSSFNLKAYRRWVRDAVGDLNYIGFSDLAYYYKSPFLADGDEPRGSWHCHLIIWGAALAAMKEVERRFNAKERTFVPGAAPCHFEVRDPQELAEMVFYMAKGNVGEYSAHPIKREVADQSTGEILKIPTSRWRNQNRKIAAPALIRVLNCIGDATFKQVCIANGNGKIAKRNALKAAREHLQQRRQEADERLASTLRNF